MSARLKSRLTEVEAKLPAEVSAATKRGAEAIAATAAAQAPERTGDLKRSIKARDGDKGYGIYAAWYWFYAEFGTSGPGEHHESPRPYMIPAVEAGREALDAEVEAALRNL